MSRSWMSLLFFVLFFAACGNEEPRPLTIAAASNIGLALNEIAADFTDETGIKTEQVYAASGKLTAQLIAGAPYDVFITADVRFADSLRAAGLVAGTPFAFADGPLALVARNPDVSLSIDSLGLAGVRHIAVANPTVAPYGASTMEYLRQLGLDSVLGPKLVYGESVSQVNQFVYSGAADVGFTALGSLQHGSRPLPFQPLTDAPVTPQTGVVLTGPRVKEGQEFLLFLSSWKAKQHLRNNFYLVPE